MNETKPHICMIVPDPRVHGGIASVTKGYYGSALERDFRITYVESYCDGSKGKKLKKALKAYRRFYQILKEDPPLLVHIHSSFGPSFYRKIPFILMSNRRSIPVINHIHGSDLEELYYNASSYKKKLVRAIYGRCDLLIVLAEIWKKEFSRIVPHQKIEVLPNYAKAHEEVLASSFLHERYTRHGLLFLGVITMGKGVDILPKIMKKVLERVPDAVLTMAGSGDTSIVYEGADPKVMDHIHFTGWVSGEEKKQLFRENAVFLFPSHMECFSMSILEAQGYGLPVISCRVGSIPEAVEEGKTGYLFSVDDVDSMADAIIRLFEDEELYDRMAENGIANVQSKYTLEQHLSHLEDIYHMVLQEKKEQRPLNHE